MILSRLHTEEERYSSLPTGREIFILQNLAGQHEEKAQRLYLKLCTLELNSLPKEEAYRRIARYFIQTTETIDAVYTEVAMACSGKLPAKETIQSIVQTMSSTDTMVRQIDGEMYLRNTSKPLTPLLQEVIIAILSHALSEAGDNRELCPRTHPIRVGSATKPRAGIWERLYKWLIFGRNTDSGITGWDFWQSF